MNVDSFNSIFCDFYLFITENLLMSAINLATNYCPTCDREINILKQTQKPILFHNAYLWSKKSNPEFDIAIEEFYSAEAYELFEILLLC